MLRRACLYACLSVCVSVCPLAYLKERRSNFTEFSVHVTCSQGSDLHGDNATDCVLPVLWMMTHLPITTMDGHKIQWSNEIRYLGVYLISSKIFSISLDNAKKVILQSV